MELTLESIASVELLRDEWSELAARSGSIFLTPEWISTWWRHFGRGRRLLFRACRAEDSRLVAILPLYEAHRRPLRIVRFVGHGPADELGPISRKDDLGEAARALRQTLGELAGDVFLAEQLPGDVDWTDLIGGHIVRREASPVLQANGWDEFLATRSANLREQVGRRERRLRHEHRLRFRLSDDPERLHGDLDTLFALHRAVRSGTDFGPDSFHREFAALALERGWLRLWFLELDGRPAAAWYGFRFGGIETYYQAGRDPAADRLSVGFVLLAHTIRAAFEDGLREYRFGRGAESYKYRFASEDPGLETIAVPQSTLGWVLVTTARGARKLLRHRRSARVEGLGLPGGLGSTSL